MRLKWSRFLLVAGLGTAPVIAINCPAALGVTEVSAPEVLPEEDDDDDEDVKQKQKHKKNKAHKKSNRHSESHSKHERGSMPAFSFRGPPRFPKYQFVPEGHPFPGSFGPGSFGPGSFGKPDSHSTSREDGVSEEERRFREEQLELLRNISRSLKSIEGQMRAERQGSYARGMPMPFGQQPSFQGPQPFSPPRMQGPSWLHRPESRPQPEGGPRSEGGYRPENGPRPEGGPRSDRAPRFEDGPRPEGTLLPEGRGPRPESSPREPARPSDSRR